MSVVPAAVAAAAVAAAILLHVTATPAATAVTTDYCGGSNGVGDQVNGADWLVGSSVRLSALRLANR